MVNVIEDERIINWREQEDERIYNYITKAQLKKTKENNDRKRERKYKRIDIKQSE